MKKLLAALALAVLVPITSFAISIDEITDNPMHYQKVGETINQATYVDLFSIKSLSVPNPSPSHIAMVRQGRFYVVSFRNNRIFEYDLTINYDLSKRFDTVFQKEQERLPMPLAAKPDDKTYKELFDKAIKICEQDTGMSKSVSNFKAWTLNGNVINTSLQQYIDEGIIGPGFLYKPVKANTNTYYLANYLFLKGGGGRFHMVSHHQIFTFHR